MFAQERACERASRYDAQPTRDRHLEGGLDELAAEAPSRERFGNLGMDKHESSPAAAIVEMGQLTLDPQLEAVLFGVVYDTHGDPRAYGAGHVPGGVTAAECPICSA